jgi:3-oxoacyl-[acyl-carrier protein] reductase
MSQAATVALLGKSFEEIAVGDTAQIERTISKESVEAFAQLSGDWNPLHTDAVYAKTTEFGRPVAHGVLLASYVSTLIGMHLPGPGALWAEQHFRWLAPVFAGDHLRVGLRVTHKSAGSRTLTVEVEAANQHGVKVMNGNGVVTVVERRAARDAAAPGAVLVTGGSRGIGAAVVRKLAAGGALVIAGYRSNHDAAQQVCAEINGSGGHAVAVQLDVTDGASMAAAVSRASSDLGQPVTALVNTAAAPLQPKSFEELTWQDFQDLMDVHLRGAFEAIRAVLPHMIEAGTGSIVNLGSIYTEGVPPPQWTAFVSAKAALRALTRSLASEYGPKGIRVNMVSPGLTSTDSITFVSDRLKKVQAMQTPLRQLCTPDDIADAVAFLCSPGSRMITGMEIPVCGGSRM